MAILITVAVLLLLIAGPAIMVNRDLLFNRGVARSATHGEPLPFLFFPVSNDRSPIVPASVRSYEAPLRGSATPPSNEPQSDGGQLAVEEMVLRVRAG